MAVMDLYGSYLKGQQFAQNKAMQDAENARQEAMAPFQQAAIKAQADLANEGVKDAQTFRDPRLAGLVADAAFKNAQITGENIANRYKGSLFQSQIDQNNAATAFNNAGVWSPETIKRTTGYEVENPMQGNTVLGLLSNIFQKEQWKAGEEIRSLQSQELRKRLENGSNYENLLNYINGTDPDKIKKLGANPDALSVGPYSPLSGIASFWNTMTGKEPDTSENMASNNKIASDFLSHWSGYDFSNAQMAPIHYSILSPSVNKIVEADRSGSISLTKEQKEKLNILQSKLNLMKFYLPEQTEG